MHVSLSKYIEASRKKYYRAFEQIEKDAQISGVTDITPFLTYMNESVYEKLPSAFPYERTIKEQGLFPVKEQSLLLNCFSLKKQLRLVDDANKEGDIVMSLDDKEKRPI